MRPAMPGLRRSLGPPALRGRWFGILRASLWPLLPRALRRRLLNGLLARRQPPLAIGAAAVEPVAVVGILSTASGIGEGGRLSCRALAALGVDLRCVDVSHILEAEPPDRPQPPPLEPGPGTAILHFNPDNLPAILSLLGRERLRGKRIIGYWAWELERLPEHWRPALAELDEIWVPTRFVAEAVRAFTARPVRVVPHPVAVAPPGNRRREHFGFGDAFVVLTMFSFRSFCRKNPLGAVEAFRRAFGAAPDRLLVLKCLDSAEAPEAMAQLRAAIGSAPNIRLDRRRLGAGERLDLIASADALLSLHRAEGFGLVMAEAMAAGVPVVATAWSGNLDYMDQESALLVPCRSAAALDDRGLYRGLGQWAEPDLDAAASLLGALADDPRRFDPLRRRARRRVAEALGPAAFAAALAPTGLVHPIESDEFGRLPDVAGAEAA